MPDEALCRRCAQCCYEKIVDEDGEVYQTPIPCKYLDIDSGLCTVYGRRHDCQVRCLTVAEGITARAFPADCPYVQGVAGYRAPLPMPENIDPDEILAAGADDDLESP